MIDDIYFKVIDVLSDFTKDLGIHLVCMFSSKFLSLGIANDKACCLVIDSVAFDLSKSKLLRS